MSVGGRVKYLLDSHGHSLRKAQEITGVSHETIRRITNGWEGPTLIEYIRRIAKGYRSRGYHVDEKSLMEGLDPKGDFEWTIHQSPFSQRLEMVMMSLQDRVRLTLDFLRAKYPSVCRIETLAAASGLNTADLARILTRWQSRPPERTTAIAIAYGIHRLTDISMMWFNHGWLDGSEMSQPFIGRVSLFCTRLNPKSSWHSNAYIPNLLDIMRSEISKACQKGKTSSLASSITLPSNQSRLTQVDNLRSGR